MTRKYSSHISSYEHSTSPSHGNGRLGQHAAGLPKNAVSVRWRQPLHGNIEQGASPFCHHGETNLAGTGLRKRISDAPCGTDGLYRLVRGDGGDQPPSLLDSPLRFGTFVPLASTRQGQGGDEGRGRISRVHFTLTPFQASPCLGHGFQEPPSALAAGRLVAGRTAPPAERR